MNKIKKTEAEWQSELDELEYKVLRQAGTERPFTGKYYEHSEKGSY